MQVRWNPAHQDKMAHVKGSFMIVITQIIQDQNRLINANETPRMKELGLQCCYHVSTFLKIHFSPAHCNTDLIITRIKLINQSNQTNLYQ